MNPALLNPPPPCVWRVHAGTNRSPRDCINSRPSIRAKTPTLLDRSVEPQQQQAADLILTQPFPEAEITALCDRLWSLLTSAASVSCWEHETFRAELLGLLAHHEYSH